MRFHYILNPLVYVNRRAADIIVQIRKKRPTEIGVLLCYIINHILVRSLSQVQCKCIYSITCVKRLLSKRPKNVFQDQLSLNADQAFCNILDLH